VLLKLVKQQRGEMMNIDDIVPIMMGSGCLVMCLGWVTVAIIDAIKGRNNAPRF
jgi:hypothetical protein